MSTATSTARSKPSVSNGIHALVHDVGWIPLSIVNAYVVGPPGAASGEWVLVDAGLWTSGNAILHAVGQWVGRNSKPAAIILTHGHFDHVGSVKSLAERWNVPVYAHPLELPYLTGKSAYPPADPTAGGGLMAYASLLYPRGPIDLRSRVRPLPADGSIPGMPGWRWIHTPGHSPGHVSLCRGSDRFLIAGDAFVTTRQESAWSSLTKRPSEVHRPPAYFTPNWQAAGMSVRALADLQPEWVATGHGFPMRGERMQRQLKRLADEFYVVAVPKTGRYSRDGAQADERGVSHVPPPDPILVAGGIAAAVAAGFAIGCLAGRGQSDEVE